MPQAPEILTLGPLPKAAGALLASRFAVVAADSPDGATRPVIASVRGIATSGKVALGAELLARLPNLEIVSCLGAGTEGLDLGALAARGIAVATTSHVLAADVADIAIGLVIALARDFRRADRFVRDGNWAAGKYPLGVAMGGARLGILGLGTIGAAVAQRAAALGMEVGYHNRVPKRDVPFVGFGSLVELAEWSRFLVVCCPGGAATRHLVGAPVLAALGPRGWLVNVARGSVVDEAALVAALASGTIAGAGLDVFEAEPTPDPRLLAQDNTILLPHVGSATEETRTAMACAMVEALVAGVGRRG